MEERVIDFESRQALRQERRRRQIRRARFLQAVVWVLAIAGLIVLGREMISSFRRISPPPTGSADQGAEPAGRGPAEVIPAPRGVETGQAQRDLGVQGVRGPNVIDRCQDYPEDLLKMLSRNLDMLDFVLEYPEKQGRVFADTIGEVEVGEIPLLLQYDQRWGYGAYGASSVAVSGCGPACLSMVAAGLTGDNTVTPYAVAQYAGQEGYYVYGAAVPSSAWWARGILPPAGTSSLSPGCGTGSLPSTTPTAPSEAACSGIMRRWNPRSAICGPSVPCKGGGNL